jgi:hypothetical protein
MVGRTALAILGAAVAACPTAVFAKEYQLSPSSKWLLDYAADSCQLSRAIGVGDEKVVVQFTRYEPGPSFDFNLIGKPIGENFSEVVARVRFGPVGDFVRTDGMAGSAGNLPAIFLSGRLDNLDLRSAHSDEVETPAPPERRRGLVTPAVEAAVTSVTVRVPNRTIILNLGSMGPPMAELRKCTADLVKEWGLNPTEQEAVATGPKPKSNPGEWLYSSDYPQDALAAGHQAIIRFRLMIGAAGQVTSCVVQSAIAKGNFGKISCDLLTRRARFEPALATNGLPVPSYYVGKVRWVMR